MASRLISPRRRDSFKGDYGHVLVVAGSSGKTGAALMCARAALRSGSGLVTIGVPESLAGSFEERVTEEMLLPLPDDGSGMMASKALDRILEFSAEKNRCHCCWSRHWGIAGHENDHDGTRAQIGCPYGN